MQGYPPTQYGGQAPPPQYPLYPAPQQQPIYPQPQSSYYAQNAMPQSYGAHPPSGYSGIVHGGDGAEGAAPLPPHRNSGSGPPPGMPNYSAAAVPPPPSAVPTVPPAYVVNLGLRAMSENPFGPGMLPRVNPVTGEMRLAKAIEVAKRHLENGTVPKPVRTERDQGKSDAEVVALEARNEHNMDQLEMTSDLTKYEHRLGSGILYFFSFLRFLFLLSCVFAIFQSVTFGNYIRREDPDFGFSGTTSTGASRIWLDNFMISNYRGDDTKLWMAMNIICIVLTFFSAPIYFWWLKNNEETKHFKDREREEMIIRFSDDARIDVSNLYRSPLVVTLRRVTSVLVIAIFVGLQIIASYFITQTAVTNIGISFAISFVVAILNVLFLMIAERLTEFECWSNYNAWKRMHTLKLLFFRLANIITVFAAKRYDSSANVKCAYDLIGQQFITLLLIDIFVVNTQGILLNMLFNRFVNKYVDIVGSILGDEDNLPKFDLALEYLQAAYRQYLVMMAMVVCPFSIFLSMVGFVVDYACKKFNLTKLCGTPRKVDSSQKEFLTFVLLFIAVCALLTPFAGSVFMLSGMTRDKSNVCVFP